MYFDVCMEFSRYNSRIPKIRSGDEEIRTLDPLLARQVLSQLSYIPILYISLYMSHALSCNGLKWTRTTDLTLIRRAL